MNKCSICEKEIPTGATECSLVCNQEASKRFRTGTAADAKTAFSSAMRQMLQPKPRELQPRVEVPMILIKHRWKRNKNETVGSVVLGFNDEGIAKIPDLGNNRLAAETYCRFSKGLAEIVVDQPKALEQAPATTEEEELDALVEAAKAEVPEIIPDEPKAKPKVVVEKPKDELKTEEPKEAFEITLEDPKIEEPAEAPEIIIEEPEEVVKIEPKEVSVEVPRVVVKESKKVSVEAPKDMPETIKKTTTTTSLKDAKPLAVRPVKKRTPKKKPVGKKSKVKGD